MKKLIVLFVMVLGLVPASLFASERVDQHLTQEEFRAKQQAFIAEKAGLTAEEAAKFFPLYFCRFCHPNILSNCLLPAHIPPEYTWGHDAPSPG